MSEFYQIVKIDGKGFGCVATKDIKRGTLILREKAQMKYPKSSEKLKTQDWIKGVVQSFNQMNKKNQEEFWKLHNYYLRQDLSSNQKFTKHQSDLRSIVNQMYNTSQVLCCKTLKCSLRLKISCIFHAFIWRYISIITWNYTW